MSDVQNDFREKHLCHDPVSFDEIKLMALLPLFDIEKAICSCKMSYTGLLTE